MSSPFFFPTQPEQPQTSVNGYSILLGALSSGNLPQQSIQSILSALPDTVPFGVYHDPAAVEPFVTSVIAHNNNDSNDMTTTTMSDEVPQPNSIAFAIELYVNHTVKTIFIVQRARIIEQRVHTFVKAFCSFLDSLVPSCLIVLSSLGPSHRPAENLDLVQFFTVEATQVDPNDKTSANPSTSTPSKFATMIQSELKLPATHMSPTEIDAHNQYLKIRYGEKNTSPLYFPLPIKGGGLTRQFAKHARKADVPLVGLLSFPGPGAIVDLGTHALKLVSLLLKQQHNIDWTPPQLVAVDLEDYC